MISEPEVRFLALLFAGCRQSPRLGVAAAK